jgi:cell division protein ZapB
MTDWQPRHANTAKTTWLTPIGAQLYSFSMDTDNSNQRYDLELARLEKRLDELVVICRQLKDENKSLRQRQDSLIAERATLLQKNELVRGRVEAMIGRLKSMEQTS